MAVTAKAHLVSTTPGMEKPLAAVPHREILAQRSGGGKVQH